MDWVGVIAAFALGWIFSTILSKSSKKDLGQSKRQLIEAEYRYLDQLRRELAIWLIRESPAAFRDVYSAARAYDLEMRTAKSGRVAADRASLAGKYPSFEDFDLVGLKHFVPFEGHRISVFAITQCYMDISKFLTLLSIEQPAAPIRPFSDRDEEVIERVVQNVRDADLRREIEIAMGRYYAFRQHSSPDQKDHFSDRDYEVTLVQELYTPETRYGVTVKADERRGTYWFFHRDDKDYEGYEETDETFTRRRSLTTR